MPELSRSLQPRHITTISIGGMIGAGLLVSSSAAIAATGPAIVVSYLITGTRVLFVLAEHGDAPPYLVQLNARRLVNASGALMVFVYLMIAVAHRRVRRAREAGATRAAPAAAQEEHP